MLMIVSSCSSTQLSNSWNLLPEKNKLISKIIFHVKDQTINFKQSLILNLEEESREQPLLTSFLELLPCPKLICLINLLFIKLSVSSTDILVKKLRNSFPLSLILNRLFQTEKAAQDLQLIIQTCKS